jgi:cell wall-associated NlpC family hydrolase
MKKLIIFAVLFVITLIGYIAAGPFITIHQIKSGVDKQDSELLSENIDFPLLRSNVKEQLSAYFVEKATSELKNNPLESLVLGIASKFVDGAVDAVVTPSGLANLMEGKQPKQIQSVDEKSTETKRQLFRNARYSLDSIHKFSIWVKDGKGDEIRFVLTRDGLSWKLTNIIIPMLKQPESELPNQNTKSPRQSDAKRRRSHDDNMGQLIARTAERFVNIPYRRGGDNVQEGFDSSGLVRAVYNLYGINIPSTIDEQFKIGENVTRESLREGDLVFFGDSESRIDLVGIYLGNGRLVHAGTREGDSVKIGSLDESYFANYFVGARRYF